MSLVRFGVSLDEDILKALDEYVVDNNLPNRSQAIRHMVEKNVVEKKWQCNNIVAGAITLLYDCDKSDVAAKILDVQKAYHDAVLSTQVLPMGEDSYLQIVAVKGKAATLTELADKLIGIKGLTHGKLNMTRVA